MRHSVVKSFESKDFLHIGQVPMLVALNLKSLTSPMWYGWPFGQAKKKNADRTVTLHRIYVLFTCIKSNIAIKQWNLLMYNFYL